MVSFSKDDSLGAWGKYVAQVNLHSPEETYTLTATATNPEGKATDSITLAWRCEAPPPEGFPLDYLELVVLGLDTGESIEFIDYKITNLSDHPIEAIEIVAHFYSSKGEHVELARDVLDYLGPQETYQGALSFGDWELGWTYEVEIVSASWER